MGNRPWGRSHFIRIINFVVIFLHRWFYDIKMSFKLLICHVGDSVSNQEKVTLNLNFVFTHDSSCLIFSAQLLQLDTMGAEAPCTNGTN